MTTLQGEEVPQSWRNRLIGLGIQVGLFLLIFVVILPLFINYEDVWEALKGLTFEEFLVLFGISLLRIPTEAMIYRALLPGLHMRVGSECYLSQNVAGLVLPPPTSSIIQYAYFRSDDFERRESLIGAVGSFIFPSAGRMIMPLVAAAALVVTGEDGDDILLMIGISVAVLAIAAVLVWFIGRSDSSAQWIGDQSGRAVSWVLARFNRPPVVGLGRLLVNFRKHTYAIVSKRWVSGTIAVTLNLTVTTVLLVVSMRFVGIDSDTLSWSQIFAALAVGFFAGSVLPLTSSGLGGVDLIIIGVMTTMAGGGSDTASLVAAGEFVWRIFYSILMVPVGIFTLNGFRKKQPGLIKDAWDALNEMREAQEAAAQAAGEAKGIG